ncbi:MAG: response regulator [Candidatus Cyclobacteriaceae bacterium M3_2C_046]
MLKKLLLVDDDDLTSFLIGKLIKGNDSIDSFEAKENGYDALEYLKQLEKSNYQSFPEILLVDIDMPVMNGYEFVEAYENHFWKKFPNTKILMVTSSKRKLDFERCLSYKSVTNCIYKPLTKEILSDIVENVKFKRVG